MPKVVDYPLFPFARVMELAHTVDYLGGSCTIADCAHHMKKKISGGFGVLISSAIKHDLVHRKGDRLSISDLYKKIKFSYSPAEKIAAQRLSFLHPVLYRKVYDRFKGKELPLPMLDKLLIREFQVEEKASIKIAGYFVDGLKPLQLIRDGKLLAVDNDAIAAVIKEEPVQMSIPLAPPEEEQQKGNVQHSLTDTEDKNNRTSYPEQDNTDKFVISIQGNGINSTMNIDTQEDFQIVEAILAKIKRKLGAEKK